MNIRVLSGAGAVAKLPLADNALSAKRTRRIIACMPFVMLGLVLTPYDLSAYTTRSFAVLTAVCQVTSIRTFTVEIFATYAALHFSLH